MPAFSTPAGATPMFRRPKTTLKVWSTVAPSVGWTKYTPALAGASDFMLSASADKGAIKRAETRVIAILFISFPPWGMPHMSIVEEVNLWRSRHSEPPKCDSVALNRLLPNNLESLILKKRTCLQAGVCCQLCDSSGSQALRCCLVKQGGDASAGKRRRREQKLNMACGGE